MTGVVDAVLVRPGGGKALYGNLGDFALTAIEPPLWAALHAACLSQQGYAVELLDAVVESWDAATTAQRIQEINPRLVLIIVSGSNPSASTMSMPGAGDLARELAARIPQTPVAMWGLHPSALPRRTLEEEAVAFVCQGEGFVTLPALVEAVREGRGLERTPGLWYRENGVIRGNPQPPLVKNLDRLPAPAWDRLPMERYRAHNWHCFEHIHQRQPYAVIYTSLGCPFHCDFCCINSIFGGSGIRYRSPELVIQEIDHLVSRWGIRNIKIMDEMFALNEKHVSRLCDLIVERGHRLNIWAYARVNTVNQRMLAKMKQAGINWLAYGFESGNPEVLGGVAKGYRPEAVDGVVRMTYEAGINICANFIFGLPDDDLRSMRQTLDLALDINAEWANFYSAMAYPGSKLHQKALDNGWPLPPTWQAYSQYAPDCLPLPTKHLGGPEVLAFRDQAFLEYFTHPKVLAKLTERFGAATADHVRAMTRVPLVRQARPKPHRRETDDDSLAERARRSGPKMADARAADGGPLQGGWL